MSRAPRSPRRFRVRLRSAVLEHIEAELPIIEAVRLGGVSRVTVHD